mgnify:CR=1 FL=1|jgi:deoxyuridine 5'-triphosphate nucleotidohydrolase|tara:strand:+ start:40543 stop:40998 length:456 start_codon:yes stop_codon:yes gene_type:complete
MIEQTVRVFRTRETAKVPTRAHDGDAGMDFYYCPQERSPAVIHPGHSALLQTGVKVEVPKGYMLQIMNKSGIASKRSLITGACVVDHGYTGEIFINLHNIGRETQMIEPEQKLAQGVFINIASPSINIIEEDNIYGEVTSRGDGALGSTGE